MPIRSVFATVLVLVAALLPAVRALCDASCAGRDEWPTSRQASGCPAHRDGSVGREAVTAGPEGCVHQEADAIPASRLIGAERLALAPLLAAVDALAGLSACARASLRSPTLPSFVPPPPSVLRI
jgi:hypothetical protein